MSHVCIDVKITNAWKFLDWFQTVARAPAWLDLVYYCSVSLLSGVVVLCFLILSYKCTLFDTTPACSSPKHSLYIISGKKTSSFLINFAQISASDHLIPVTHSACNLKKCIKDLVFQRQPSVRGSARYPYGLNISRKIHSYPICNEEYIHKSLVPPIFIK